MRYHLPIGRVGEVGLAEALRTVLLTGDRKLAGGPDTNVAIELIRVRPSSASRSASMVGGMPDNTFGSSDLRC